MGLKVAAAAIHVICRGVSPKILELHAMAEGNEEGWCTSDYFGEVW